MFFQSLTSRGNRCSQVLVLIIIGIVSLNLGTSIGQCQSSQASLYLSPAMYLATRADEEFKLDINISRIVGLHYVEVDLIYNTTLLDFKEVLQGFLFPVGPGSKLKYEVSSMLGIVRINATFFDPGKSVSGNGTLASIVFRCLRQENCSSSFLILDRVLLNDTAGAEIYHDVSGGVYFWGSGQEDPSIGSVIDLFTRRGGRGPNFYGGKFAVGEQIELLSRITYNLWPLQNKLIAFEVLDPANVPFLYGVAQTGSDGIAIYSFRTPPLPSSVGYWTCVSVASVDQVVIWDWMVIQVVQEPVAVGGYSVSFGRSFNNQEWGFVITAFCLSVCFVSSVLRYRKRHE